MAVKSSQNWLTKKESGSKIHFLAGNFPEERMITPAHTVIPLFYIVGIWPNSFVCRIRSDSEVWKWARRVRLFKSWIAQRLDSSIASLLSLDMGADCCYWKPIKTTYMLTEWKQLNINLKEVLYKFLLYNLETVILVFDFIGVCNHQLLFIILIKVCWRSNSIPN